MGQGDFLRLMTTQLSQQDPFDPVDNQQMVAQMAQFSSLAGISETNTTLQKAFPSSSPRRPSFSGHRKAANPAPPAT